MRLNRYAPALLALTLPLAACGADDVPIQRLGQQSAMTAESAPISPPSTSVVTDPEPQTVETTPTTEPAPPTTEPPVAVPRPVRTVPPTTVQTVPETMDSGALACGGSLPPCWVMRVESRSAAYPGGGDPRVWNGGCYDGPCRGGSWASGKWQFMPSTWGGYGGYANAADAPVSMQDAKARLTWAGGAGCSHWSAC